MFAPLVAIALLAQSISVTAGATAAHERTRFRFETPSRFDTDALVPHVMEHKYEVPRAGIFVEAAYGPALRRSSTRVSFIPRRDTRGSDIDTFFQPSGDIATSGTDGPISYGGFAIDQRVPLKTLGEWHVGLDLGYRRDVAEFEDDFRVVTHTQPPSVTQTFITDEETTITQLLQVGATARHERVYENWRARLDLGVSPVIGSRLLIRLPQKYPGVDLIYSAVSFGTGASWTIERAGRWRAGVTFSASGAWGYRKSSTFAAHRLGVSFFVGSGAG
jgi:hypothetical protein